jgi:hypothetical protein
MTQSPSATPSRPSSPNSRRSPPETLIACRADWNDARFLS